MKVLGFRVSVVSFLLQHMRLLEPFFGTQLVSLGSLNGCLHTDLLQYSAIVLEVLVGSEGGVNSVLLLHVHLGLVPLSGHLVELVLGTLGGGEGCMASLQLHHGNLLSLSSPKHTCASIFSNSLWLGLVNSSDYVPCVWLVDVDTGGGDQLVLGALPRLAGLFNCVLLVNLHVQVLSPAIYNNNLHVFQFSQIWRGNLQ